MDLKVAKKAEKNASMKSCSDCHTTKTPLWRGGPAGPKSLCNACGIKYNKKRRQQLGLGTGTGRNCRKKKRSISRRSNEVREILKMRLMAFGNSSSSSDVLLQRSGSKLREEERAALLLMALSCSTLR